MPGRVPMGAPDKARTAKKARRRHGVSEAHPRCRFMLVGVENEQGFLVVDTLNEYRELQESRLHPSLGIIGSVNRLEEVLPAFLLRCAKTGKCSEEFLGGERSGTLKLKLLHEMDGKQVQARENVPAGVKIVDPGMSVFKIGFSPTMVLANFSVSESTTNKNHDSMNELLAQLVGGSWRVRPDLVLEFELGHVGMDTSCQQCHMGTRRMRTRG